MLYPNQINSNFFRRMMMAGWYADREVVCEQLPLHLNELIGKNELEQFLKEIWYLSFIDDIFKSIFTRLIPVCVSVSSVFVFFFLPE